MASTTGAAFGPAVGIGYRWAIDAWTMRNLAEFDALEITVDHCAHGGAAQCTAIFDLPGRIPLTAHGIGLSIGSDMPLDLAYLDRVAEILERLKAPAYSEHLAFTRVPGRDLANLVPLPRTEAVAEAIVDKIRIVRSRIPVPFLLENIAYAFEWPDSAMTEEAFFDLVCRESGAGMLLDVENLYVNARNHGTDPRAFLDALPQGIVREIHIAGGIAVRDPPSERRFLADTHSHPVPAGAYNLLTYALRRQSPSVVILERDERLDTPEEILADVGRIRACIAESRMERNDATTISVAAADRAARASHQPGDNLRRHRAGRSHVAQPG